MIGTKTLYLLFLQCFNLQLENRKCFKKFFFKIEILQKTLNLNKVFFTKNNSKEALKNTTYLYVSTKF